MEDLSSFLASVSSFVWGPVMLVLLLGTGLYLTLGLGFLPQRKLGYGFRLALGGRKAQHGDEGEITPFQALTTALSATIGTGNIAGVATAIFLGGPGAVFWMWLTALVGMATKYAEAVLAVRYRESDENGRYVGGPMYYIRNGLGPRFAWLGWLFALFATIAAFGIGNTVQSNSVARALESTIGVPYVATGVVLAVLTFLVIIGGVKRIGSVAEHLVPLMAVLYVGGALVILALNIADVPAALGTIFSDAFSGTAAAGGFAGAGVLAAIRFGVARGVFSNEAGLGSAPIAHAAAKTSDPVRQGSIAMLGTFIDTIVVCTMTALVIITTGAWTSGETGAELSALAFDTGMPGGSWIVTFGLVVFAFTTILGWSYYGERAAEFIFGSKIILPFRLLWVAALIVGAVADLGLIWTVADIMNALMAIPNLIALIALSGTVFAISRAYFKNGQS
ncbi:alanine:cation symporter family protein [Afifella marina DSM 2698]|uniref:Alanine or glycine:cation symporter, AGCS family n=2 Tax=Afifella marina TaxID=1080 RepID=A0A1G5NJ47_AFIMA|nr:alanine:cation symporter family protein [Afifella marina DSM 2698]MBK1626487.1 alanine:cation symporter family protein [Afifella marina]MBK5916036.1 sodium:alanine symporter family protein [Afifella marina]RAI18359.1 sodium:alanine symporter family protein [Afifella marina DSM 2698]SCZ36769.1 alanine or glycine:cation symporter, AGCS family [Afifella marina DSM 2698]